ncbi:MAG: IS110 family transposase [Planctomycetes bacterium]|nr:IS110 family transposase [Planctomycetota bacterium]
MNEREQAKTRGDGATQRRASGRRSSRSASNARRYNAGQSKPDRSVVAVPGRFVGLDAHKRQVTVCILDAAGEVVQERSLPLVEAGWHLLLEMLQPQDQVALEATTHCWELARRLEPHVARVVVSNPLLTRAIAHAKVKTDRVDARVLAHLLRLEYLPAVWHPDETTLQLRQLSARREALVGQRTALRNRIHSVLAMRLLVPPFGLFTQKGQAWLQELLESEALDEDARLMLQSDLRLLQAVQEQIERLEQRLAEVSYPEESIRLLMTLPGVDLVVAVSLWAAIGDIRRFPSPDHLASYLGLVPSTRQSADRCHHGPITKRGRSQARWMVIQAAQQAARHPGPLGHFFRRLKRRKGHNVAVVATARKLVTIAWHILTKREPYRYAVPRSTEAKLARLRVRATGERRRGGVPKGQKATAKRPGGSRTIKSLDRVYASEGLPPREPLPAGEQRMLRSRRLTPFVESLGHDHILPRRDDSAEKAKKRPTPS